MKTVYLNEDNTVREIIPEYALPPEKWYSEAFARRCVEVQDNVEQGWRYNPETGQAAPDTRPSGPESPSPGCLPRPWRRHKKGRPVQAARLDKTRRLWYTDCGAAITAGG